MKAVDKRQLINYDDDTNLFNFVAYDGKLIKPEETIFRDKGVRYKII